MKHSKRSIASYVATWLALGFAIFTGAAVEHQLSLMRNEPQEAVAETTDDKMEVVEAEPVAEPIKEVRIYNITAEPASTVIITEPDKATEEPEPQLGGDELELMATCIEAEAGNQSLLGKRLVAAVILNRTENPAFPDTVTEVISQPHQFSTYTNGAMDKAVASPDSYKAIALEMEHRTNEEVVFFNCGDYLSYGTPWDKVGDHYFSTF